MKKLLVLSAVIATTQVFAQSVDYSRCQRALGALGPQINAKGELEASPGFQAIPDVATVEGKDGGKATTYTFKSEYLGMDGKPIKFQYRMDKDKAGNITGISSMQDKVAPGQINMQKQWALNNAVYSGLDNGGLAQDTMIQLPETEGEKKGQYTQSARNFVFMSKLTKEQAKLAGVDLDELKELKKHKKKDSKMLGKIAEGYSKILNGSHLMIPNGIELRMKMKDGVCNLDHVKHFSFDVKDKTNHITKELSQGRCEEVMKIQKKYESELVACANTGAKMNRDLYGQGGVVGGMGSGLPQGYGSGYGGQQMGISYGYGQGPYGTYGLGNPSPEIMTAAPFNMEVAQCQMYFDPTNAGGGGYVGGVTSGAGSGAGFGAGFGNMQ